MTTNFEEDSYLDLMHCLVEKTKKEESRNDRTGVGCVSRFGDQLRFNLENSFPMLTTKKVFWKGVFEEMAWFLQGNTNAKSLQDKGVNIWNEWSVTKEQASKHHSMLVQEGDLGPVYGAMWRRWPIDKYRFAGEGIDQLKTVVEGLQNKPYSRRHVVSSWNPTYLPNESLSPQENVLQGKQALPPCHCLFQFFVEEGKLSCQLYQRSADIFLGTPFNIPSYSLLTAIIANICDLELGEFILTFGDVHLYSNHLEAAETQLKRSSTEFPKLKIKKKLKIEDLDALNIEDFELINYNPQPAIKAPIAI